MRARTNDEKYMQHAFALAQKGLGYVSPNPMVGCVIVHDHKIIGEGWHEKYGEAHAEVNAIKQVEDPSLLKESTVYVSLEPCSHTGKTPPCTDLLTHHQVKRVVISHQDPFPQVNGRGIRQLKAAGISVDVGILAAEGRKLNQRFLTSMTQQRPYVILKWAQTADGFIARKNFDSKWISHTKARRLVHQWRAEEDAIMVGTHTARHDNPMLNVRDAIGNHPLRIVIDKQLSLPPTLHLFDQKIPTLCYNLKRSQKTHHLEWVRLKSENMLPEILSDLHQRGIQSVLVEGGTGLLQSVISQSLWDEARVFQSTHQFQEGIPAPDLKKKPSKEVSVAENLLRYYSFDPLKN